MPTSLQFDPSEPHDWHYLSAIPLTPATPLHRTSFSPAATLRSPAAALSGHARALEGVPPLPPHLSPRPERADVPSTPQLNSTPTMGAVATFPGEHPRESPADRAGSPQRPPRPLNPEQALMFNSPLPPLPSEAARDEAQGEHLHVPYPILVPASHTYSHGELHQPAPASPYPRSPQRKPVPDYLPEVACSTPLSISPMASPSPDGGRLSVGRFEALLARQADAGPALEDDEGGVVWSPRMQLGLDVDGVDAREARRRWDEQPRRAEEQDLGVLRPSPPSTPPRHKLAVHTPAEHIFVSPRGTRARIRQTSVQGLAPPTQAPSPHQPRSIVDWLRGNGTRGHGRLLSVDDDADADVRAVHAGPQLRRGSKRLSELSSCDVSENDAYDTDAGESARGAAAASDPTEASQRRSPTEAGLHPSVHSSPSSRSVLRRGESRYGAGGRKARSRPEDKVGNDQFEVVVLDPREKEAVHQPAADCDWQRLRTTITCRPERMDWSMCDFEGRFPRLVHLLYPFVVFAHIPATLFLDYNLLYILCQLALFPAVPSPTSRNIAMRALVDVPNIRPSTGWWVAVAIYASCTAAWFFGICLWKELGRECYARWKRSNRNVEIEKVYAGAASYNLACLRSYSHFSFFWRIRLAPFRPSSAIARSVEGTTWLDGVHETAGWYRQNWPTLLLLLPRAGLAVAILLLYSTTAYGTTTSTTGRDTAYFGANGTLTGFGSGVIFANAAWAAWRVGVWVVAVFAASAPRLSYILSHHQPSVYPDDYHASQMHVSLALPDSPAVSTPIPESSQRVSALEVTWCTRRQRRIRSAILACLGTTPLSVLTTSLPPTLANSPYVVEYAAKKQDITYNEEKLDGGDAQILRVEHDQLHRRASASVPHDKAPVQRGSPLVSYRQLLSTRPHHSSPPLAKQIPPSPLIHFSPATPSPPRFYPPPDVALQANSARRRRSVNSGGDLPDGGDVGASYLHRRIRSIPLDQDDGVIVFPSSTAKSWPSWHPTGAIPRPPAAQLYASVGETQPRQLLPRTFTSAHPPLVSQSSAFSSKSSTSTPLGERNPDLPKASRSASSASPSPPRLPAAGDDNRSATLQAQLAAEADARSDEERGIAGLRRVSQAATSAAGTGSFATARESRAGMDDARWSQRSPVGVHSDASTVRDGRQPAPDFDLPAMPLGSPPAEGDELDSEDTSTPEREGGMAQSRVPLGFSHASAAESLALSAYNSPDLTGGDHSAQFEGATPMTGRSRPT
ncbi:hypothetical protein JCM3770_006740 [Rhodotorula araucariae]